MAKKREGDDQGLDLLDSGNVVTKNPNLPDFGVGGNIFDVPGSLLTGSSTIGADGGSPGILTGNPAGGFLAKADVGFDVPGINSDPNMFVFGNQGSFLPGNLNLGSNFGGGSIITLPPFIVTATKGGGFGPIITETSIFNGATPFNDGGGNVSTGEVITMTPFVVTENRITTPPIITEATPVISVTLMTETTEEVITLTPFVVIENRITTPVITVETPTASPTSVITTGTTSEVITMTPFVVTEDRLTTPTLFTETTTGFTLTTGNIFTTPVLTTAAPTPVPTPSPTFKPTDVTPQPTLGGTGGTTTTTGTSSAMTERDLDKELEKTMAAFAKYRPQIQQMYGDLYSQFMPKGLTAAEPGVINQYQQDLARLQQRQAGMLSPEDIRQSQQAAREAYGARGQVMGKGAIGAEILNREAIRQQREDQARQALQQSYGNILNMSNLQTGNIFSPIGSLMSSTFNPMGAYPADVYGTNVNAQLAREITQRNNEAAIRAAELTGSAAKSASNTSLLGDLLKVGGSVKIALACMPGDQPIDTPVGPVAVQDLKGGDKVVGYDGSVVQITQVSSYVQDADRDFFTFHLSNGGKITVCDRHKIMDIPASEWVVGAAMGDAVIERIDRKNGVTTSYDLVTEVGGYRIAGVSVNSMIPEMLAATLQLVALKHAL